MSETSIEAELPRATLVFTSIGRFECARVLIESARRHYPALAVLVGDQGGTEVALNHFCDTTYIRWLELPYDAGLSVARNRLVKSIGAE